MDLGEPFKEPMIIQPGGDGSFIVVARKVEKNLTQETKFGFTTIDDLLIWMARHGTKARVTELKQDDIVGVWPDATKAGYVPGMAMDQINGLRLTSAAKTLAERVEAMGMT